MTDYNDSQRKADAEYLRAHAKAIGGGSLIVEIADRLSPPAKKTLGEVAYEAFCVGLALRGDYAARGRGERDDYERIGEAVRRAVLAEVAAAIRDFGLSSVDEAALLREIGVGDE